MVANSAAMKRGRSDRRDPGPGGRRIDERRSSSTMPRSLIDRPCPRRRTAAATRRSPGRRRSCSPTASPPSARWARPSPIGRRSAAPATAGRLKVRLMSLHARHRICCRRPQPDGLALRRAAAHGRGQALRRRRARLARRVAQAALSRQAGHARAAIPFGCGNAEARRQAAMDGFQVATHAIGDAANAQIISAR